MNFGFILVLLAIGYFVLIRPEQRKRKEHAQLIAGLKRNDHVVMISGIHGRVVGVGDKTLTVEIAPKIAIQVDSTAIQAVRTASEAREKEREKT